MLIDSWAFKWKIPVGAIEELKDMLSLHTSHSRINPFSTKESDIQRLVQQEAMLKGCILWRNNVGALQNKFGKIVRYGLGNTSTKENNYCKSSDLIGIRPVRIEPCMVGKTIGQFLAREVKKSNWKYKGDARELAQKRFMEWVISKGGDALFVNGEGSI